MDGCIKIDTDSPGGQIFYQSLWELAYEDLRKEKSKLVEKYEDVLEKEHGLSLSILKSQNASSREEQMSALFRRKLEELEKNQWRLTYGNESVKVRDKVDRFVKVIVIAKDCVSVAVNADPVHAGLAWAPICLLLSLLTNDLKQRNDSREGIEDISRLSRYYSEVEKTYGQGEGMLLPDDLQCAMKTLYRHILEYEARVISQLTRPSTVQFLRNSVMADSWERIKGHIRQSDSECKDIIERLDRKILQNQSRQIKELIEKNQLRVDQSHAQLYKQRDDHRQNDARRRQIEEESKCFECLRTTEYEFPMETIDEPVKGTCNWFLNHVKHLTWEQSPQCRWLWVTADPGCGKSVLSKHIVNRYRDSRHLCEKSSVCYFFFRDDSIANRSIANALCAILHQLFKQNPVLLKYAVPEFQQNGRKLAELPFTLWDVFIKATTDPLAGSTVCVFDALDECGEVERSLLIQMLATFSSNSTLRPRLKIVTTSRSGTRTRDIIRRYSINDANAFLQIGDDISEMRTIADEINIFITSKLEKLRGYRQADGIYDDAHLVLGRKLATIQNRTYLWVALIFMDLEENSGLDKQELLNLVETIPNTVDDIYRKMLAHASNHPRARKLLSIIMAAKRPLTLTEINIAMSIEAGQFSMVESWLKPDSLFEKDVRKVCGHFVCIQDSKLYLVHQTAKDFLMSNNVSSSNAHSIINKRADEWKSSFTQADSNFVLAHSCVSYLLLNKFQINTWTTFCHSDAFDLRRGFCHQYLRDHGFLDYAATFWHHHCRETPAEYGFELVQRCAKLCDVQSGQFMTWICLTRSLSQRMPIRYTDLIIATQCGLELVVKMILEHEHPPLNATDDYDRTALCIAARLGYDLVVKLLLETKAVNINAADGRGRTPLWYAAFNGHNRVVEALLKEPSIDPNARDRSTEVIPIRVCTIQPVGSTPLEVAMYKQHRKVIELLLDHNGVDPNASLASGQMVLLHAVARHEHVEVLKLLLQRDDIDPYCKDEQGLTPLGRAAKKGHPEVVQLLLDYCIKHKQLHDESIPDKHSWNLRAFIVALGDQAISNPFLSFYPTYLQPASSKMSDPDDLIAPFGVGVRVESDGKGLGIDAGGFIKDAASIAQVRSNHPIPPLPSHFYCEVQVVYLSIVLGRRIAESDQNIMPGYTTGSCGYNGYDGGLHLASMCPSRMWPKFGAGDTVGCGFDYRTNEVFYTKNGEFLGAAFTGLRGPISPVIGIQDEGTCARINFGNEPFMYNASEEQHDFNIALRSQRSFDDIEDRTPGTARQTHDFDWDKEDQEDFRISEGEEEMVPNEFEYWSDSNSADER